jgi:hypothetical protein
MGLIGELIVGVATAYLAWQIQDLSEKVDKATIEIEKVKGLIREQQSWVD